MATVFLGFTRCDLHRLPGEGQNGHRAVLCRIIGPIRRRIAENKNLSLKTDGLIRLLLINREDGSENILNIIVLIFSSNLMLSILKGVH